MRPWIIVLTSATCAILAAAALVEPELSNSTSPDLWVVVRPHIPMLAVAVFGIYALCAMLLTTGALVAETLLVRHSFGRSSAHRVHTRGDWAAALGSIGLHQLTSGLITEATQSAEENATGLLTGRFHSGSARSEIGRLHYLWLARSHFFSAVIVLTALAGLGLAQDHGPVPSALGTIPTISAILILAGLILLAILGRIALDVSAEPLIEAILQMPAEPRDAMLLRRAIELTQVTRATESTYEGVPKPTLQPPERLQAAIEEGHRALLDSVSHLVMTTEALGTTLRSSIDALNSTITTSVIPLQSIAERDRVAPGLSELQRAVEALTAVLERLTTTSAMADEPSHGGDIARTGPREPRLARELRQLLQEIGEVR